MEMLTVCHKNEKEFDRACNEAMLQGFKPLWDTFRVSPFSHTVAAGFVRDGFTASGAYNTIILVRE